MRDLGSERWRAGWVAGGGVVVIAATLLVELNLRARRIARQADEIAGALHETAENSAPLFELAATNLSLDRAIRGLREQA